LTNAARLLTLSPQFSPLSIIRALWKRKLLILTLTLLGTLATFGVVSKLPPVYTANAVILVESQKIPENFVASTVQTSLEAQLDTLKQQVLSHDRLWGLVESSNLYKKERLKMSKEEVLVLMRQDIVIGLLRGWSARGPGAFQVEYQAPKPETAAEIANQIGMFFINENLRQRTAEATATSQFLDGQLTAAETRLREQEAKLKVFKLAHNGELPEQEGALLAAAAQSRTELLGIQEGLGRAQQNKLILESSLAYAQSNLRQRQEEAQQRQEEARQRAAAGAPAPAASNQPLPPTPLEQAQAELARLRSRYHNTHPEVQRMLSEVQRLQRDEAQPDPTTTGSQTTVAATFEPAAAAPVRSSVGTSDDIFQTENNRIQELRSQLAIVAQEIRGLEQRRERVLQEVAEAQARIRNLPAHEQQLAVITRDYDTSKSNYQSLLTKKLAADVASDMERWQKSQKFVMLDPARIPQKPTRPRKAMLTAGGSLLSLALAGLLAFLLELRMNVLFGEWELPPGMVILGRIPLMKLESR